MKASHTYLVPALLLLMAGFEARSQVAITGTVTDDSSKAPLPYVSIQLQNSNYHTVSDKQGHYRIEFPRKARVALSFKLLGYHTRVRELTLTESGDSIIQLPVAMSVDPRSLEAVSVYAKARPDTILGSPAYSVYDFDFYEDRFILLTAVKSLKRAALRLVDLEGRVVTSFQVPEEGGEAKELFHDYMGFTNLICERLVYRINIYHDRFVLIPMDLEGVNRYIKPIVDTINGKLLYSDYWRDYPAFSYFSYHEKDSSNSKLLSIENKDLMHAYNFEYYAMKPYEKLEARRIAMEYHIDKRVAASLLTGFTRSMFYEPLYAPLYVVQDTICIFDHYKDLLFHIDRNGKVIDSVGIRYNHPKNWKEWKNVMLKDDVENKIYAVYEKNGHKYIKEIGLRDGKEKGRYTLQFHSADKLRIHDGYAYYIYRPFESTQEKFFYRERISLSEGTK